MNTQDHTALELKVIDLELQLSKLKSSVTINQQSLFNTVRAVFDNEDNFLKHFYPDDSNIVELSSFYMSGSKCLVTVQLSNRWDQRTIPTDHIIAWLEGV